MSQHNARVIAKAPEMREFVEAALTWWHSVPQHFAAREPAWVEQARALLQEIEGKENG